MSRRQMMAGLAGLMALPLPAAAGAAPFGPWLAPLLRDHALVGTIMDAGSGAGMSRRALEKRLRGAAVAIVGEVHDNPDHHRIQGQLLKAFAAGRRQPPAVVFEMIAADMQARVDEVLRLPDADADMLFDAVRWDQSGWPSRDLYRPLMDVVMALKAPVIAAGLPRRDVRRATREGLDAVLPEARRQAMQLAPLPEALMNALVADIVKSHCDMITPKMARRMSVAQRWRDALLAEAVRRGWRRQGAALLVTGNGHARRDRAVPLYLARHGDVPAPLVVWQAEAREKAARVAELLPENARPPAKVADVVIVTPRARREDPCRQFARFMERRKEGGQRKEGGR